MSSVAMAEAVCETAVKHLARPDGQEDLCFAVWFPSQGEIRLTALLERLVLPTEGDRVVHGNVEFLPAFFERALQHALEAGGGLAFLHSHPARGWQGMSDDDEQAERGLAPAVLAATGLPLLGMTLAALDHVWSARFWSRTGPRRYSKEWCETVRVVGTCLGVSFADRVRPPPRASPSQLRTLSSWGEEAQAKLARLHIGVVGLGSVGSIVSEALARVGVQHVTLLDFDSLDEVNLDRTLGAEESDLGIAKVVLAGRRARKGATAENFLVDASELSVCEEAGYRKALDCDLLFSCVDRPWPRATLNFIAYAYLIPVVDAGIHVSRKRDGTLRGAEWKAHVVGPSHRCLACLEQYSAGLVAADREGHLDDPSYIESLPNDHPARSRQNVFAFSLGAASLQLLQMLSTVVAPAGLGSPGAQTYHFVTGRLELDNESCKPGCEFPQLQAKGDRAGHPGTASHPAAERARAARAKRKTTDPRWSRAWVLRLFARMLCRRTATREPDEVQAR